MLTPLAISSAKLTASVVKLLKLGKASALPGRVALALNPDILKYYSEQIKQEESRFRFIVSGTNGKTTTTGLLKQICIEKQKADNKNPYIICNDMGANLYYGICSELVNSTSSNFKLKSSNYVLELDEASIEATCPELNPDSICITNIYRDQLDRFGEIDSTLRLIVSGIQSILSNSSGLRAQGSGHNQLKIILNADDPKVYQIQQEIESNSNGYQRQRQYISYSVCHPQASIQNFDIEAQHQSQGADIRCQVLEENIEYSLIKIITDTGEAEVNLPLPGLYNTYNATAAAATAYANGIDLETIKAGLESYSGNFGRAEHKSYNSTDYQVFLIKNPTGCSEVLRHLSQDTSARYLIIINDNYADGRDVSWLWDAKFEYLSQHDKTILCSGRRAQDMALRLKYAGIPSKHIEVETNLIQALESATNTTRADENLYLLPTYTALLELNKF